MRLNYALIAATLAVYAQAAAVDGATHAEVVNKRAEGGAATQEVPTDFMSQIIGAISQILETSFSGSGAMLSNLIG
ncbi:hypothetical protein Cantr_01703 [Candida viswanathii]|uniref:Uncharacterized protein n=1 Tax=Candida viswanathii TaxID=5486 RepID=A0A367YJL2_9ASCO|nr:hypothetical protein Cantr_01703 [Candida viswanathii]